MGIKEKSEDGSKDKDEQMYFTLGLPLCNADGTFGLTNAHNFGNHTQFPFPHVTEVYQPSFNKADTGTRKPVASIMPFHECM